MAGLYVPLPTLRRYPRGYLRTARGQCGSLFLHCDGLSPSTPCRSPGAHAVVLEPLAFAASPEKKRFHLHAEDGAIFTALIFGFISNLFVYALYLIRLLEQPFLKAHNTFDDVSLF